MNYPNQTPNGFAVADNPTSSTDTTTQHSHDAGQQRETDLELFQTIRRLTQALEHYSQTLRERFDLTLPQTVCLQTAAEEGPVTATVIAHRARMSASTVVGILDSLEDRKLIERVRDTQDRRLVNVSATDDGRRIMEQSPLHIEAGVLEAIRTIPRHEQAGVARSLRRLADIITNPA
ncbi:MarR family transcriptional regulator [candidate division GN15 bacterium]|nr:MarR family transcriptional regulator [candidate division GN15 bacterium]